MAHEYSRIRFIENKISVGAGFERSNRKRRCRQGINFGAFLLGLN